MVRTVVVVALTAALAGCLFPSFSNLDANDDVDAGNSSTASVVSNDPTDGGASAHNAETTTTDAGAPADKPSWSCGNNVCQSGFCCFNSFPECRAQGDSTIGCEATSQCDDATDCGPGAACCKINNDDDIIDDRPTAVCRQGGCGSLKVVCRPGQNDCPAGKSCQDGKSDVHTCG
jgi:hypothetical protein